MQASASGRSFHSRLNLCVAVTAVQVPKFPLIASSAPISGSRLNVPSARRRKISRSKVGVDSDRLAGL